MRLHWASKTAVLEIVVGAKTGCEVVSVAVHDDATTVGDALGDALGGALGDALGDPDSKAVRLVGHVTFT